MSEGLTDEVVNLIDQLKSERDQLKRRCNTLEAREARWAEAANGYLCGAGVLEELRKPWREWHAEKMAEPITVQEPPPTEETKEYAQ